MASLRRRCLERRAATCSCRLPTRETARSGRARTRSRCTCTRSVAASSSTSGSSTSWKSSETPIAMSLCARWIPAACVLLASGGAPSRLRARASSGSVTGLSRQRSDPARRFYGETLGLAAARRRGGGTAFLVGSRAANPDRTLAFRRADDDRLSHLAFATTDVKGLAAYLTARGLQVEQPPDRCEDSAIRVRDPDGHPIEFVEAPWPPPPAGPRSERALSTRVLHAGLTIRRRAGGARVLSRRARLLGNLARRPTRRGDAVDQHARARRHRVSRVHVDRVAAGSPAAGRAPSRGVARSRHPGGVGGVDEANGRIRPRGV